MSTTRSPLPIIAIAGLACETSTFTPARTEAAVFKPRRGREIISSRSFLHPGTALGKAAQWRGALTGHALPGGQVTRAAFEELADEIIDRLEEIIASAPGGTIDGLWYDIHGAMCVEGMLDVEVELLRRLKVVIGKEVIVSASMDLHGNVSRELVHQTDLITCYRTAPHVDEMETEERACRNLVDLLKRKREEERVGEVEGAKMQRPLKAWIPIPILLPGEKTSTRMEPARHIYSALSCIEATKGIIDAAVWVGYAWADEPRNRAAVVVTGWEINAVSKSAEKIANLFWSGRRDFAFVAPAGSFDRCLDIALASSCRPFFISDSGDNPTAGGSGDVTWTVRQLLSRLGLSNPQTPSPSSPPRQSSFTLTSLSSSIASSPSTSTSTFTNSLPCTTTSTTKATIINSLNPLTIVYASLPTGPAAMNAALESCSSTIGSTITITAGALIDSTHSPPLTLTGTLHSIKHGDIDASIEIVLLMTLPCRPSSSSNPQTILYLILTSHRKPYHHLHDFLDLNLSLPLLQTSIIIIKIGYLEPELFDLLHRGRGGKWMLALTPGGVDQAIERLEYKRLRRPMWPFDGDGSWKGGRDGPDLTARFIAAADEELRGPDE